MVRVINANMAHGVREITVKRGVDPREFPLVVAGGAAGLHACEIAREIEIDTILVPGTASVLCAAGMLLADANIVEITEANMTQALVAENIERVLENQSLVNLTQQVDALERRSDALQGE